jgi:membrane protease YdiL (CAAX protease family)
MICWYAAKIERRPLLLWEEKRYAVGFYLLSIIAIFAIILAISVALYIPLNAMGFKPSTMIGQLLTMTIPLKIFTVVTAGVMEELVFRGYIQSRLQLLFKTPDFPVLISAAGFGLLHAAYGTLINMLIPFVIGVVFGYHYYKYRNIKVLIICHLLIDANAMFYTAVPKH